MQRTIQQQPSADVRMVFVSSEGRLELSAPKNDIGFSKVKNDCVEVVKELDFIVETPPVHWF